MQTNGRNLRRHERLAQPVDLASGVGVQLGFDQIEIYAQLPIHFGRKPVFDYFVNRAGKNRQQRRGRRRIPEGQTDL